MAQLATRLRNLISQRGFFGAVVSLAAHAKYLSSVYADGAFDRRYGTDTSTRVQLSELRIESPNVEYGGYYQAISVPFFKRMLRSVRRDYRDLTFIDLGSGKGRALMLASLHGFRRIIGVEFSKELVAISEKNLERFAARTGAHLGSFELCCMDAQEFAFPRGPLAIFLYNPFSGPVMVALLARLDEWTASGNEDLIVFYRNPECHDLLDRAPFLETLVRDPAFRVYSGVRQEEKGIGRS